MPIAHRAAASAVTSAATAHTLTIAKPTGTVETDGMFASIEFRGGSGITITPPSGWTEIIRTTRGTTLRHVAWVKVAGASEPADYTWTWTGDGNAAGGIETLSGIDTVTPNGTAQATNAAATTNHTTTSVTVGTDGWVISTYGVAAAAAFTPDGATTEQFDVASTDASLNVQCMLATEGPLTGASTARTATTTSNQDTVIAIPVNAAAAGQPTALRRRRGLVVPQRTGVTIG